MDRYLIIDFKNMGIITKSNLNDMDEGGSEIFATEFDFTKEALATLNQMGIYWNRKRGSNNESD